MNKEEANISDLTWNRAAQILNKTGYMDGASDGQTSAFQASFNVGYTLGFDFGLQLGFQDACLSFKGQTPANVGLRDARKINCHVCVNKNMQDKIENLYNLQQEKNTEFFNLCKSNT